MRGAAATIGRDQMDSDFVCVIERSESVESKRNCSTDPGPSEN
jgi:hypothetical protein